MVSKKEKLRIIKDYLSPYWANPSKETKDFVNKNFEKMSSAVIKGKRAFLEEVAVCLLLKWGYLQWRNFFSETLLRNSFLVAERDVQLSDNETNVVFILHLAGTQRNSYLEEAICNNYTFRDMLKKPTIIFTEEDLPKVEDLVRSTGKPVLGLNSGSMLFNKAVEVKQVSNFPVMPISPTPSMSARDLEIDPYNPNSGLGPVFGIKKVKKDGRTLLEVTFSRGTIKKYTWENNFDRLCAGEIAPAGVKWYEI